MSDKKTPVRRLGKLDDSDRVTSAMVKKEEGTKLKASSFASKFRPKNFVKPEAAAPSSAPAVSISEATSPSDARPRRQRRPSQPASQTQGQHVAFGGGIGAGAFAAGAVKREPSSAFVNPSTATTKARSQALSTEYSSISSSSDDESSPEDSMWIDIPCPPVGLNAENQSDDAPLVDHLDEAQQKLLLFQLPSKLPLPKQEQHQPASLRDLPPTKLGKLILYKSGAARMAIGDVVFDVSPGIPCRTSQQFAVVDTQSKHCTVLGPVSERVVVAPNIDDLLDSTPSLVKEETADR